MKFVITGEKVEGSERSILPEKSQREVVPNAGVEKALSTTLKVSLNAVPAISE